VKQSRRPGERQTPAGIGEQLPNWQLPPGH